MSYNGGVRNIFLVILQGELTISRTFFKLFEKKTKKKRKKKQTGKISQSDQIS